jgi:hypothetical protein
MRCRGDDDAPLVLALTLTGWARLRDALIAALFWALDPEERRRGLDGSDWPIEGRRKDHLSGCQQMEPGRGYLQPRQAIFRTCWPTAVGSEDLLIRRKTEAALKPAFNPAVLLFGRFLGSRAEVQAMPLAHVV